KWKFRPRLPQQFTPFAPSELQLLYKRFLLGLFSYCEEKLGLSIIRLVSPTTVYRYSREDLIRILRVSTRQLVAWEKAGLLAAAESYTFFDLLQVKKVRDLCARHVRPIEIRQSLAAMQKQAAGMDHPLLEANASTSGRH